MKLFYTHQQIRIALCIAATLSIIDLHAMPGSRASMRQEPHPQQQQRPPSVRISSKIDDSHQSFADLQARFDQLKAPTQPPQAKPNKRPSSKNEDLVELNLPSVPTAAPGQSEAPVKPPKKLIGEQEIVLDSQPTAKPQPEAKYQEEKYRPAYKDMEPGLDRDKEKLKYLQSLSDQKQEYDANKQAKNKSVKAKLKTAGEIGAVLGVGGVLTGGTGVLGLGGLEIAGVTNFVPDDASPAQSGQASQNISINIGDTTVGSSSTTSPSSTGTGSDTIALIDE